MKKPRKHKPKHKHAAARPASTASRGPKSAAFDWDGLLARTAAPRHGKPAEVRAIALTYSRDERSALGLLLLPFVLMAFAMGLTQTMKALRLPDTEVIATTPAPAAISEADRLARAIRAAPRAEVSPAPLPADSLSRPADVALAPSRPVTAAAPLARVDGAVPTLGDSRAAPPPAAPAIINVTPLGEVAPYTDIAAPAAHPPDAAPTRDAVPSLTAEAAPPAPLSATSGGMTGVAEIGGAEEMLPAGKMKLAALAPLAAVTALTARDSVESLEPAMPSRSICVAPPSFPRNGRSVAALPPMSPPAATAADTTGFGLRLAAAAEAQMSDLVVYTDRYKRIAYPMGDVPPLFGVCTDVVVRAYRSVGLDLQALVQQTRIGSGDTSIDHRRVETLRRFFAANGASLKPTDFAEDYQPGDIVTYYRPQNRHSKTHIAIVSDKLGPSGRPMIVHNRGWGPQIEDGLFVDQITGHYRFTGLAPATAARLAVGSSGGNAGEARTPAIPAATGSTGPASAPQLGLTRAPRANAVCRAGETTRQCPAKPAAPALAQRRASLAPVATAR